MSGADHFLARWSRLKRTAPAVATEVEPATVAAPKAVISPTPDQANPANQALAAASPAGAMPATALPDPASLTLDSDFTAFLKDEVGDAVRRQALKKLFNDPHFNVMDGLDIYIGDYSVSQPIPPELLAKLRSAREWLAGRGDEEDAAPAPDVAVDAAADGATGGAMVGAPDDTMVGATDGAHAREGARAGSAIAGPAPAAAQPPFAAAPTPATIPAAVPTALPTAVPDASAAVTVEPRQ